MLWTKVLNFLLLKEKKVLLRDGEFFMAFSSALAAEEAMKNFNNLGVETYTLSY
jgi:hypothetical protein